MTAGFPSQKVRNAGSAFMPWRHECKLYQGTDKWRMKLHLTSRNICLSTCIAAVLARSIRFTCCYENLKVPIPYIYTGPDLVISVFAEGSRAMQKKIKYVHPINLWLSINASHHYGPDDVIQNGRGNLTKAHFVIFFWYIRYSSSYFYTPVGKIRSIWRRNRKS